MIVYFIGGSRDLSKQSYPEAIPSRVMLYLASGAYGPTGIVLEHYECIGKVPPWRSADMLDDTYIYAFRFSEQVELTTKEG